MRIYLRNVVGLFGLTLCLLLGGAGCLQTAETPSGSPSSPIFPPTPAGPEPTGTLYQGAGVTPPEDNRAFSLPNMSWYSSEDGRGFYIPGSRILSYYDLESRRLTPLCAQSGCMHVDETCGAWLGEDVRGFLTYDGDWYVLSSENSGAVIRQIDPPDPGETGAVRLHSPGGVGILLLSKRLRCPRLCLPVAEPQLDGEWDLPV